MIANAQIGARKAEAAYDKVNGAYLNRFFKTLVLT
jgi:hypothetical protein